MARRRKVFEWAGAELAATAIAVAKQIAGQFLQAVPVSYAGGSFAAGELLLSPLRRELQRAAPPVALEQPVLGSTAWCRVVRRPNAGLGIAALSASPSSLPGKAGPKR